MRFKDNADGTVTDTKTGFMWQKDPSRERMEWGQALDYVIKLNTAGFAGHTDWRLPSRDELLSLMEEEDNRETFLYLDPVFGKQRCYWTANNVGHHEALYVDFFYGGVYKFPEKYVNHSVKAIRGSGRLS